MRYALFAIALFAAPLTACRRDDGPLAQPPALPYAAAGAACAPLDGPAVTIYLSESAIPSLDPTAPHVQLTVWRAADQLAGTWSLAPDGTEGQASRMGASHAFLESAVRGTISVHSVGADRTVAGIVDVTFASGTRIRGSFTAPWIARTLMCG